MARCSVAFSVDCSATLSGMKSSESSVLVPSRAEMERAFAARDPGYDGVFFVAVRTTGIFCRPSCASRPQPANVEFLPSVRACLSAGYRPCKRCLPDQVDGAPPPWVAALLARLDAAPDRPLRAEDLRALGITPERARRWFQEHHGMTFTAWCRARRLAGAFARLREGASLDEATFAAGFESHSGFREAFRRTFGEAPGRSRASGERVVVTPLESPLGPLLAGARDEGICLLEFADRRPAGAQIEDWRRTFRCAVVPGTHPWLDRLRIELDGYFAGGHHDFVVPLAPRGTPFQQEVWRALGGIPYGVTISYEELARRVGRPTGQRAVALANAANRIAILIPCHRVIGKDGTLTGYGGGLWRKRLLLELERTGRLPG